MTVLSRFLNLHGEEFIVTRVGSEVFIDGDDFSHGPKNIARLDFMFSDEEKTCIDRIVPIIWDYVPFSMMTSSPGEANIVPVIRGFMATGAMPELTHMAGYWLAWDTAEQVEFLRRHADGVTMDQYAIMRGFASPKEGESFLHSFADRAGCSYVTHRDHPSKCWLGNDRQTMKAWLVQCDEMAESAYRRLSLALSLGGA